MLQRWASHCCRLKPNLATVILNRMPIERCLSASNLSIWKTYNKLTKNQEVYLETIKKDYEKAVESRGVKHNLASEKFINKFQALYEFYDDHCNILKTMAECHELLGDQEMRKLAESEISELKADLVNCYDNILYEIEQSLQPSGGSIFLEIRSAAGGTESSVFAADLYRIYESVATMRGFKWTVIDEDSGEGIKRSISKIVVEVAGPDAGSIFQFEGGVHRVQRVPFNDTRIHTSTVAVIILQKPDDIRIDLEPDDMEISFTKSSGPGGQFGDSHLSKCSIYHKPTNIRVTSQTSRLAHENKQDCLIKLKSAILKKEMESQELEASKRVKNQVKQGDRSDKIRTYNYKSGTVLDHRYKVEVPNVQDYLVDPGKFMELHKKVSLAWQLQKLAEIASDLGKD